jgi:hypothetical protein
MERGPVPAILAAQVGAGWWPPEKSFYTAKYRGTVWQLLVLAELLNGLGPEPGADGRDERIGKACDFIVGRSQERESGGFAMSESSREGGGRRNEVIPCLTGNLAWALIALGRAGEGPAARAVDWILRYQRCDDGAAMVPATWPYDRYEICWGSHSCHMGVVKSLKALAALPSPLVTKAVATKRAKLSEYLLAHRIHKRSHALSRISRPGWLKLGFPLMYQTDILEILGILVGLGYRDERMAEAIEILRSKGGPGRPWRMENSFNGKMIVDIEEKGAPSKWITLKAVRILCAWDG